MTVVFYRDDDTWCDKNYKYKNDQSGFLLIRFGKFRPFAKRKLETLTCRHIYIAMSDIYYMLNHLLISWNNTSVISHNSLLCKFQSLRIRYIWQVFNLGMCPMAFFVEINPIYFYIYIENSLFSVRCHDKVFC